MTDLSKADTKILSALQAGLESARSDLAAKVGMSPSTLWRRMKELEASGIIGKQVMLLDPEKAGFPVCVFVFIQIKDYSSKSRANFESFVRDTPEIMECFSVTGAHDYTLIIRTRSVSEFERLLKRTIVSGISETTTEASCPT